MNYLKNPFRWMLRMACLCLIVSLLFTIQSCDDDDEPKDVTLPEITFTNLNADMEVWNTVAISLDASDDLGLADIQIFVDDELVTTLTEAPFEASWDSNQVPDGSHTVKVVATDKSGNTKESTVNIIVRNTLLTIDIAADQLLAEETLSQRGFVFLSDEDGKLIASAEYTNGNDVTLKSSSFNGEKFFLTEVVSDVEGGAFTWVSAFTWPGIKRGTDWVLFKEVEDDDEESPGVADITLQNADDESSYFGSTNGVGFFIDGIAPDMSLRLAKDPSKLFVIRDSWADEVGPLGYGLFSNIVVGENTVDFSQVNLPLTKQTFAYPEGATYLYVYMRGLPDGDDFSDSYAASHLEIDAEGKTADLYYPGSAFPAYYTNVDFDSPDMYYSSGRASANVSLDLPEVNGEWDFVDSKLVYSWSGDFDVATVRFYDEAMDKRWRLTLPQGEDQVVPTFEIPTEMQALSLPSFGMPQYYVVHDFGGIGSYDDLVNFITTTTIGADELYEGGRDYQDMQIFLPGSGGRRKTDRAGRKESIRLGGSR